MAATQQFNNLQALRAVSCVLIVLTHAGQIFAVSGLAWAAVGVDLFLVMSGFLIPYTTKSFDLRAFALKRIKRIVPLYWIMTLAVFGLALVAPGLLGGTRGDISALLASLFFIPFEKAPAVIQPILFVGWTLNCEAFFYALFAVCMLTRSRIASATLCAIGITALVALGAFAMPTSAIGRFYTSPFMLDIAAGLLLFVAWERGLHLAPRVAVLMLFAAGGWLVIEGAQPNHILPLAIPATLIVWAVASLDRAGLATRNRAVLAIGAASFSIYLAHPFALAGVEVVTGQGIIPMAAGSAFAILSSYGVYLWLERPMALALEKPRHSHTPVLPSMTSVFRVPVPASDTVPVPDTR